MRRLFAFAPPTAGAGAGILPLRSLRVRVRPPHSINTLLPALVGHIRAQLIPGISRGSVALCASYTRSHICAALPLHYALFADYANAIRAHHASQAELQRGLRQRHRGYPHHLATPHNRPHRRRRLGVGISGVSAGVRTGAWGTGIATPGTRFRHRARVGGGRHSAAAAASPGRGVDGQLALGGRQAIVGRSWLRVRRRINGINRRRHASSRSTATAGLFASIRFYYSDRSRRRALTAFAGHATTVRAVSTQLPPVPAAFQPFPLLRPFHFHCHARHSGWFGRTSPGFQHCFTFHSRTYVRSYRTSPDRSAHNIALALFAATGPQFVRVRRQPSVRHSHISSILSPAGCLINHQSIPSTASLLPPVRAPLTIVQRHRLAGVRA